MQTCSRKKELLLQIMKDFSEKDLIVAFSGGVDSSLLLKIACDFAKEKGSAVYAVTMQTKLHPAGDMADARKICAEIGARHLVITVDELQEAGILNNPTNRCYLCKKHLFMKMLEKAESLGVSTIIEGTNEDDLHVYRPGIRALKELCIISPLAEAGMTKQDVRNLAEEYGLSAASKPSTPCLATRFPYGTALSYKAMALVEKGETYLKNLGFYNVRLRIHDRIARIETDKAAFPALLQHSGEITAYLKSLGYDYITLDLEGFRSGSMDIAIPVPKPD
ncbi:MAG: ATP-dependent sacrificial sulfur transferase LarE [Lachnospiraceae bacterium]|nr:ATP-dependent sacrificial sulfur transferase LarE [Lachnospiraceae bacterium]